LDATSCYNIIQAHVTKDKAERDEWDLYDSWYMSEFHGAKNRGGFADVVLDSSTDADDDRAGVETNYTFAFVDTMIANVCPLNPQVTVRSQMKGKEQIAKNRSKFCNDLLRRVKAYEKAWEVGSNTAICSRGVTKVFWSQPLGAVEVEVIDSRRFFFDRSTSFDKARYACEVTLVTKDEFQARLKRRKRGAPAYDKEVAERAQFTSAPQWSSQGEDPNGKGAEAFQWAVVYEFYDFAASKYYHFLDGVEEPLISGPLPYKYTRNPFVLTVFNRSRRDHGGVSDVKLMAGSQEQLNEIDSLELMHAFKSMPITAVNSENLDSPEDGMEALENVNKPGAIVDMKLLSGRSMADTVTTLTAPSISPSFNTMRSVVKESIAFTLALADYQRGRGGDSELATELSLIDAAMKTRNGRRIKVMEGWVSEVAKKALGIQRQMMDVMQQIPVLETGAASPEMLDIDALGFDRGVSPEQAEKEWWYLYDTVPFSPTENNRLVQLNSLQKFFTFLVNNPNIDQRKLVLKFLELLGLDDLVADGSAPQAPAMPQAPAQTGGNQNLPTGQDRPATGGMPAGMEGMDPTQTIPPTGRADQAKV
jgi:hypothetical protein